jgi:hypothetical protein
MGKANSVAMLRLILFLMTLSWVAKCYCYQENSNFSNSQCVAEIGNAESYERGRKKD